MFKTLFTTTQKFGNDFIKLSKPIFLHWFVLAIEGLSYKGLFPL